MENREEQILERFAAGTATEQEKALVSDWVLLGRFPDLDLSEKDINASLARIEARLALVRSVKRFRLWPRIAAAASIVLIASVGIYFYQKSAAVQDYDQVALQNKIIPGKDKAILTLADGSKIDLTDAMAGGLAQQGGVKISKTADGQLIYEFAEAAKGTTGFNTVSTPNGGQHQISLPDGSKVWLNAASSLKFPVSFASMSERRVELSGEGYFEVARDKKHPFVVSSIGQTVEVLGTHFDVNAYGDGGRLRTTLLEGSVRLAIGDNVSKVLVPGQQASFGKGTGIKISAVDVSESVAWKEGYFMFNNESLENIMLSVSRWYDVDIEFKDNDIKDDPFWGTVSRFAKVGDVLKVLERTGEVHFKIEGRKIIVSK
ncbi:DUF4974 domain-containing protein [Pedobacter sp. LMG 31464]|uniref:DUF4974 domain-containing protein n=1 Tax=Pedobacter planticolens TaxID=2679964 RepID=A0A923E154_9SPHI|nr:FecR family protein [Pedobacter planticolens]MBB2146801.1 DUF4974 domain-containing protein [Pedobacter planticolens]